MKTLLALAAGLAVVAGSAVPASSMRPRFWSAPSTLPVACGTWVVTLPVTWYWPTTARPRGLVWLQHGFLRTNENVAALASRIAREGVAVVAATIPSLQPVCNINNVTTFLPNFAPLFAGVNTVGSPLLASARAAAAARGHTIERLPERFVFSGHSVGGSVVTLVAKEYVTRFASTARRLRGLVLLDPVEDFAHAMETSLPSLSEVAVLAIASPRAPCNANGNGTDVLRALGRPFVGFELTTGSHCDAEGASGNPVLCGAVCGAVRPQNVWLLHVFAVGWFVDLLHGRASPDLYPGGGFYDALTAAGVIRTL